MKLKIILLSIFTSLHSCYGKQAENNYEKENLIKYQNYKRAYFASGCFWCVEAIYESVQGVKEVYSGYCGGTTSNPTYSSIGTGRTGHAESVEVIYDPSIVTYETLVDVFFGSHDPTTMNRQGPDMGSQYRSIAFYIDDREKEIIKNKIQMLEKTDVFNNPIITEVEKFKKFYYAEEYHQDYEKLNPNNPYVRSVSIPRLNKFKTKFPEILKSNH